MAAKWLQVLGKLRKEWEIHTLVLVSLSLQMLLFLGGGSRKRNVSWCRPFFLWSAYLLADYVAVYALGSLSRSQKLCDGSNKDEMRFLVLWAPFLILHLGGQDTITAFAVEDNELWLRHLLSLVTQVVLAAYVYSKSHPPGIALMKPAIVMFVAGFIKYAERILALRAGSMGCLRSSMVTEPDPGPNYAKFVEECQFKKDAGLDAKIEFVEEKPSEDDVHVQVGRIRYDDLVYNAHRFFLVFRRLLVDLILSFQERADSLAFFRKLEMDQAFKVVELELMLMYECLHTKALVIHTAIGRVLRAVALAAPVAATVLFFVVDQNQKDGFLPVPVGKSRLKAEIVISYLLLGGAFLLEIYAFLLIIVSPWTYVSLRSSAALKPLARPLFGAIEFFQPEETPTWSNKMPQYNVMSYCLEDKPGWHKTAMERLEWRWNFRVKTLWDGFFYTEHVGVPLPLKQLIFDQLKTKANSTKDPKGYRKLGEHRGQWALQRRGLYQQQLDWSVDGEFDECILLWHIATDLCFYEHHPADEKAKKCCGCCSCSFNLFKCLGSYLCFCSCANYKGPPDDDQGIDLARMSRMVSDYMVYLLVMLPFMMPAGIGQIRFGDTCAEAKSFFRRGDKLPDKKACQKVLDEVDTGIADPRNVKGDRSKSVLFQACKLAKHIRRLEPVRHKRWNLIASVWVEMLCYAAGKCKGNVHAKQLSQGGELLTVVWLLMAHFGVGDQYRVESGHARAKLVVNA